MIGATQRAALLLDFGPVQEYLNQITGYDAFFPDLEDIATPRPISEAEALRHTLERLDVTALPAGSAPRDFLTDLRQQYGFS